MPVHNDKGFLNISDSNPDSKQTPRYESYVVKPKKFNVKNLGDDIDLDDQVVKQPSIKPIDDQRAKNDTKFMLNAVKAPAIEQL